MFALASQRMENLPFRCKICIFKWLFAEEIFEEQQEGFKVKGQQDNVYKLKKALNNKSKRIDIIIEKGRC